ncbi:MAG TPA: DUF72 domain-containing protein [Steroidobacteraceae bacterium]|nr:DUF72 domain-containing protein [Steroidobacteraceae bacterium]
MAAIRIGVSGWRYAPWRGVFYPRDLPHRSELAFASRRFPTIELNGSFYSLQRPASYASWYRDTPEGFVFGVKGPRYVTHMLKLRRIEEPLANFFASGVLALGEKLGPFLWQLPPQFKHDLDRIERFLRFLPRDTEAALALARRRSAWMKGRVRLAIDAPRPLRHAIEIRHESFLDRSFIELLRAEGVALVIAESAGRWPMPHDVTADFLYIRLHGDKELYRSGYSERALARWAARIRAWHAGSESTGGLRIVPAPGGGGGGGSRDGGARSPTPRDVYCYFDNTDAKLRAPADAQSLMRKLGLAPPGGPSRRAALPGRRSDRRQTPAVRV